MKKVKVDFTNFGPSQEFEYSIKFKIHQSAYVKKKTLILRMRMQRKKEFP